MKMTQLALAAALALASLGSAQAALLSEGFDDISTLAASGWVRTNNSVPVGNDWFQGNGGIFPSQAGGPDSYIANNFTATSSATGLVDAWLISPELSLAAGATLSFYTRTADAGFLDRLEVRFSDGSSSATSSFATLLSTIGDASPYPLDWQAVSVLLPSAATGRFALRYNVNNALDADYIGIDSVEVAAVVPEPSTYALLGVGVAALMLRRRASAQT